MARYLEIARRVIEGQDRRKGAQPTCPEPTPAELPVADPYAERMRVALRHINSSDYPSGMLPWLGIAQPDLYDQLTSRLPEELHEVWSEHGPLEHFETVLTQLVSLHRKACSLYRAARAKDTTQAPSPWSWRDGT